MGNRKTIRHKRANGLCYLYEVETVKKEKYLGTCEDPSHSRPRLRQRKERRE